jgi:hypothetical protein
MICSPHFIWLHFPKTAGTKIEFLFQRYFSHIEEITQDPVGLQFDPTIAWHDSLIQRSRRDPGFAIGKRTIICSFRKLPAWLMSRYNFEIQRNPQLPVNPQILLEGKFMTGRGAIKHADFVLNKYLPHEILETREVLFIRAEHFKEDFQHVFGRFIDITVIPDKEYEFKVNVSKNFIPEPVIHQLIHSDTVYRNCPEWNEIEHMVYK